MTRCGEDELIARYFAPLATHPGADGLADDAALYSPPAGTSLVVTADALVASVHFLADDPPDTIGRKALRVNLSDLAAKGARPDAFTLSLALPADWTEEWLAAFVQGLSADCDAFDIALLGGDTVKTPGPLAIAITAFGLVPGRTIPRRRGARPGDRLYVSGTIGDGALGLLVRLGRDEAFAGPIGATGRAHLVSRYQIPQPRLALAPAVLAHASAAMDISDGFVGDLAKLLRASGTSAEIALGAVPLSPAASAAIAAAPDLIDVALAGGDDYEILCAVPPAEAEVFQAMAAASGVAVAAVGRVVDGRGPPRFLDGDGVERHFRHGSFSHF